MLQMPILSVVVAAERIDETFGRYFERVDESDVEIIAAVSGGPAGVQEALAVRWPLVRWIVSDRASLVPQLWGLGVAQARGGIVALTIPGCLPPAEWSARVIEAHESPHAAIGGGIELAPDAGLGAAAIFFVRYTSYLLPFAAGPVADIPGDNGTYKREAIAADLAPIEARGFWETTINARLGAAGRSLWMDPELSVSYDGNPGVMAFSRQRFRHGVEFGRGKASAKGLAARLLHVAAAPLVPLLMLARIVRSLLRKRRHLGRFVFALPLVCWFLTCWAAGEAVGALSGPQNG